MEPLPNIDFNILQGNSLIGLLRVDPEQYARSEQGGLFDSAYGELVRKKNRLVEDYRHYSSSEGEDSVALQDLRDEINAQRTEAVKHLNAMLADDFGRAGIKYEQATWNLETNKAGRPKKRNLSVADIRKLQPFHWGYEFDAVLNGRGGFDAIITNPPWDIFKPNAREFFEEYSEVVTRNTMTIHEFESERSNLLQNGELRSAWEAYLSQFPHVSAWYRSAQQFKNQISIVNGRRQGSDINLYKLFTEQVLQPASAGWRVRHCDSEWHLHRSGKQAVARNAVHQNTHKWAFRVREPEDDFRGCRQPFQVCGTHLRERW